MTAAVLLDLGGVVYVGEGPLPGAPEAIARLRAAGLGLRFITNTTRTPRRALLDKLAAMGLAVTADELFMPAVAARARLAAEGLRAHLLVHPALEEDFEGVPRAEGQAGEAAAVVLGDAGAGFTYAALNGAFRALDAGAAFLALARNRSFEDADRALSLDAGPFVAALEFASGREATLLGKPSPDFFRAALSSLGCDPAQAVMVGDDVESDVGGAQALGIRGLLVRSGKYRAGDEGRIAPPPAALVEDLAAAADWILAHKAEP